MVQTAAAVTGRGERGRGTPTAPRAARWCQSNSLRESFLCAVPVGIVKPAPYYPSRDYTAMCRVE